MKNEVLIDYEGNAMLALRLQVANFTKLLDSRCLRALCRDWTFSVQLMFTCDHYSLQKCWETAHHPDKNSSDTMIKGLKSLSTQERLKELAFSFWLSNATVFLKYMKFFRWCETMWDWKKKPGKFFAEKNLSYLHKINLPSNTIWSHALD